MFPFHLKQNKSLDAVVEDLQLTYFLKYGYMFPLTGENNSQIKKNYLFFCQSDTKRIVFIWQCFSNCELS